MGRSLLNVQLTALSGGKQPTLHAERKGARSLGRGVRVYVKMRDGTHGFLRMASNCDGSVESKTTRRADHSGA